jgi:hypothetical protein
LEEKIKKNKKKKNGDGRNSPGPPPLAGEGFALLLAGINQLRAAGRRGADLRVVARREDNFLILTFF